jgi:hypothetical protein
MPDSLERKGLARNTLEAQSLERNLLIATFLAPGE